MSIFTKRFKGRKQDLHKTRNANLRPRLCILATKPSIPSQPQSCEWIVDLSIPPATTLTATSSPALSEADGSRPNTATSQPPTSETPKAEIIIPEKHYYFSRLHFDSHSEEKPKNVTLQIFLTSFPTVANVQSDYTELLQHFSDALEPVHLTPDSSLWLRQALFALQNAEILPPVSHGLDVNKFMSFATSYLEHHLKDTGAGSATEVHEVNYSRVLQENERLRRIVSPDAMGRLSINAAEERPGDVAHDEDIWNLPVRTKPVKAEKGWGGFWITHGPGIPEDDGPQERRNVYGGLM